MQVLPKKERRSSRFLKTSKSMTRRPKTEKQRTGREAQFLGDRDNDNDRKEDVSPMQRTVTILEMCQLQRDPRHPKVEIQDGADDQDDDEVDDEFEDVSLLCTQDQQPLLPDLSLQSEGRNMDLNLVKRDTQLQLKPPSEKEVLDVDSYMARREMTALQERWNALTMLPSPLYCIYFLVAGLWLNEAVLQDSNGYDDAKDSSADHWTLQALLNTVLADDSGCIQSSWFPRLHAVPPLPVVFVALGITLHAPFSFLYHWRYAHSLPPGLARTDHWSRRMDQAMIHAASACASYGTSGSWNYFFANVLFNAHCFYRHFKKEVNPRRNQTSIAFSMLFYMLPVIRRGDLLLFSKCLAVIFLSGWLFARYPLGGWSHSAFHLVIAFLPPLLLCAATESPASLDQMRLADKCAAAL